MRVLVFIFVVFLFSCSYRIKIPAEGTYSMADTLTFKLTDKKFQTDSVKLFTDAESYVNSGIVRDVRLPVSELMPGNQKLVLEIKLKKGKR
jgi:hypothetical protein